MQGWLFFHQVRRRMNLRPKGITDDNSNPNTPELISVFQHNYWSLPAAPVVNKMVTEKESTERAGSWSYLKLIGTPTEKFNVGVHHLTWMGEGEGGRGKGQILEKSERRG